MSINDKFFFLLQVVFGDCYVVRRFPPRKKHMFKLPSVTTPFCIVNLNKNFFVYLNARTQCVPKITELYIQIIQHAAPSIENLQY